MSNPFYCSVAFTYNNRFYHITRDESLLKFYLLYWLIMPYKILKAGWALTSPKMGTQPIKNGIHLRCYRAVRHVFTWIQHDIKSRKRCTQGYYDPHHPNYANKSL